MIRCLILFLVAAYLLINIAVSAQSIDRRVTIVEQNLVNQVNATQEYERRLQKLEERVQQRDLNVENRLASLEQSVGAFGKLLIAIGSGVLVQLLTQAVTALQRARSNRR